MRGFRKFGKDFSAGSRNRWSSDCHSFCKQGRSYSWCVVKGKFDEWRLKGAITAAGIGILHCVQ